MEYQYPSSGYDPVNLPLARHHTNYEPTSSKRYSADYYNPINSSPSLLYPSNGGYGPGSQLQPGSYRKQGMYGKPYGALQTPFATSQYATTPYSSVNGGMPSYSTSLPNPVTSFPDAYGSKLFPPMPRSLGYGALDSTSSDPMMDANACRAALRGLGSGNGINQLIWLLANKNALHIDAIRDAYQQLHQRDLAADIKRETSGSLQIGLVLLARGPVQADVNLLYEALNSGRQETILHDILLARSSVGLQSIRAYYRNTHRRELDADVNDFFRGNSPVQQYFSMKLRPSRMEEVTPMAYYDSIAVELYRALQAGFGCDEAKVAGIFGSRSDNQIRALSQSFYQRFRRPLEDAIQSVSVALLPDLILCGLADNMFTLVSLWLFATGNPFPAPPRGGQVHACRNAA